MKRPLLKVQKKLKPWGGEIWFAWTGRYAGKILELKKGHRFSLQYHEKKEETQYIVSGKVRATIGALHKGKAGKISSKTLKAGHMLHVPARTIHRMEALQDSVIFEVSTPELHDVVKLADDYGRKGKGNDEKLDRKLANFRAARGNSRF